MARKTSRERRLELFRLGNTHCPICLVAFAEDGVATGRDVTLEHAPPKALGGREACLTCEPCNQRASATSDQAAKRNTSPPELEFDVKGARRTARFWPDGIPPSRMPYRFADNEAAKAAERELSRETIVAVTQPIAFDQATTIDKITVAPKVPNARHLEVGWLRTAYLLVFSLLGPGGYVFARSAALRPVREQILTPDEEIATELLRGHDSLALSGTVITLRSNARPFFWSIRFDGGACVFVPHGGSLDHYRRIAELPEHQSIGGWEWQPRRFGSTALDRGRPLREPASGEDGLFARHYVKVSNRGSRQLWVVVNERGDALPAGPATRPGLRPIGPRLPHQSGA